MTVKFHKNTKSDTESARIVLADDGAAYAKLQSAGVPVTRKVYPSMVDEFFGIGLVVDKAKEAKGLAAAELVKAFSSQK